MPHILITLNENKGFHEQNLGNQPKALQGKKWRGFNEHGESVRHISSRFLVKFLLLENCTRSDFMEITSYDPIKFRVVSDDQVEIEKFRRKERLSQLFETLEFWTLDLKSILKSELFDLPATPVNHLFYQKTLF